MKRLLVTIALVNSGLWAAPPIPGVQNHWAGNTGGTLFNHIQNFIEDMKVKPDGSVLTYAFYDEGRRPRSVYKDGVVAGEHWDTASSNPHPSRRARRDSVTWRVKRDSATWNILHFYGRGFMGLTAAPPTGDNAPIIVSSLGDTIRSVVDPTALAFDNSGRLLVGDNGPDQNIKIFDVSGTPRLVETFGDLGGVFAGPVRGALGPKRFWGIRGLGVDASGKLYVGCTGMPMQVGGGTHIRAFSGLTPNASLLWEVLGLAFVNTLDADPDSAGSSLHKNSTRFHMDYNQPPGKSWSFAAVTVDPFKYPDDPRLHFSLESVWFRRIGGKRFLYLADMYSTSLAVIRFEEGSEIGIPTAFYPLLFSDTGTSWMRNLRPIWQGTDTSYATKRWMWRDDNGDGQVQKEEFHRFDLNFPFSYSIDVDDSGDIWWAGKPNIVQFPTGGLDAKGIPRYPPDKIRYYEVPFRDNNMYAMETRYLKQIDAMILSSGFVEQHPSTYYRYDHWQDTLRRKRDTGWTWRVDVPIKTRAPGTYEWHESVMDTCLYPKTMTADTGFVYVGYKDKGPDGWRNGEVSVLDAHTGNRVGWIAPGPETDYMSGWFDLWHALNVYVRPDGSRILMTEDDLSGKVMVYHWKPESVPQNMGVTASAAINPVSIRATRGMLDLRCPSNANWTLLVRSVEGSVLYQSTGIGPTSIPATWSKGIVFTELVVDKSRNVSPLYLP